MLFFPSRANVFGAVVPGILVKHKSRSDDEIMKAFHFRNGTQIP